MKYYVIAGEASGDLHAAKLIAGIKKLDDKAEFRCWGGDRMQAEGAHIVKHYRDLAFMGFAEVLLNLRTISKNFRICRSDLLGWKPDVLILVDYPGFNMRMAKFAKQYEIRVFYYIAPQVWAWKKKRVHKIHRYTDLAFVVLPFEKAFYAKYGYRAEYVGHPLPDTISALPDPNEIIFRRTNQLTEKPIVALLPGSRKQEISRILPQMLKVVDQYPDYQFVVAGVSTLEIALYHKIIKSTNVKLIFGQTHDLLKLAKASLVTSGTATLEAGLIGTPQVVCYRMNFFSALIALVLVKVKFISLVNLILDRKAITELVQYQLNKENITTALTPLLSDTPQRTAMLNDYDTLRKIAGEPGASDRAATIMVNKLKELSR